MREYVLSYYNNFKCIAEKCKHTCCAGWEIDIDEQSLNNYKTSVNAFSEALKQGVNFKKSKFKVDKQKGARFLTVTACVI